MARDRKRARQRRERRGAATRGRTTTAGGRPAPEPASPPVRADLPGSLDHASSDADEFDAAIVRGAGGLLATPQAEPAQADPEDGASAAGAAVQPSAPEAAPDELQLQPAGAGGGGAGARDGGAGQGEGGRERPAGAPTDRGGSRAVAFLQASWAELQRVQWPDRRQVFQATAVVLGFVVVAGAYLGLADFVAKEIVEFVL